MVWFSARDGSLLILTELTDEMRSPSDQTATHLTAIPGVFGEKPLTFITEKPIIFPASSIRSIIESSSVSRINPGFSEKITSKKSASWSYQIFTCPLYLRNRVSFINLGDETTIVAETRFLVRGWGLRNRVSLQNV